MNASATTGDVYQRRLLTSVSAFRSGCVAGVVSCTSGTLATVNYGWTYVETNLSGENLYRMTSFTNPMGRILNYYYNGPGYRMSSAAYADTPSVKIFQNTYTSCPGCTDTCKEGAVLQQIDSLNRVTIFDSDYCASLPRRRPTVNITAPDSTITTYKFLDEFDDSTLGSPSTIYKPLSRTTSYTYDNGRLSSEIGPLGERIVYDLDDRGNVKTKTTYPKTGSSELPLVEQAVFVTCDSANFRYCNKPIYTIDSRANRIDYSYDSNSGQIAVALMPADANNIRSVSRFIYSPFYPAPGVVAPSGTTLSPSYLLTTRDACLASTVSGGVIDFSYVCASGVRNRTTYLYTGSTASVPTNHELEGMVDDTDGVAVRTCYKYDVVGNRIAYTAPRAALTSCN
jgi:hypothetical protein